MLFFFFFKTEMLLPSLLDIHSLATCLPLDVGKMLIKVAEAWKGWGGGRTVDICTTLHVGPHKHAVLSRPATEIT